MPWWSFEVGLHYPSNPATGLFHLLNLQFWQRNFLKIDPQKDIIFGGINIRSKKASIFETELIFRVKKPVFLLQINIHLQYKEGTAKQIQVRLNL